MIASSARAIIVAAGESSRLGQPKQLVRWRGETLLARACRLAGESTGRAPLVVLGARSARIKDALPAQCEWIEHAGWSAGMGSSIKAGVRHLLDQESRPQVVLVMSCDQYRLEPDDLRALLEALERDGVEAAAAGYEGRPGIPACFGPGIWEQLVQRLGDARGAAGWLRSGQLEIVCIDTPRGGVDLDRPSDLALLNQENV